MNNVRLNLVLAFLILIIITLLCSSCTIAPHKSFPTTDYPDASTPVGLPENDGGIIADIKLNGRDYNVVTPNLAAKVQKWQGNQSGFIQVFYKTDKDWFPAEDGIGKGYYKLTAIDKGVMFAYDTHNW